jgi:hypothetical protein
MHRVSAVFVLRKAPAVRLHRVALTVTMSGALLAPLLVALPATPASAACATKTTKSIKGVVYGSDNRDVNVTIGFDVVDKNGVSIDATPGVSSYGCRKTGGYSVKQEKNVWIGGEGVPAGSAMYNYKGEYKGKTTRTWSLGNLPSNAASVWIEVYSRKSRNTACMSGGLPCRDPDTHKYGYVMRRKVALGSTGVKLILSRNCNYGGKNGVIAGTVKNKAGQALTASRGFAWSTKTDQNYTALGWGSAIRTSGSYKVSALAAEQQYVVWMTYNGVTQKKYVTVSSCKTSALNFVF